MQTIKSAITISAMCSLLSCLGCSASEKSQQDIEQIAYGTSPKLVDPDPSMIPTVNVAKAIGWKEGEKPHSPVAGLIVNAFASGLDHPRWLYELPNGDVLVAESNKPAKHNENSGLIGWIQEKVMAFAGAGDVSADRITLLRDSDGDGSADLQEVFIEELHSPFGMVLVQGTLYVANTDAILAFAYQPGQTRITQPGTLIAQLPAGEINSHWTKNLIAGKDGKTLYVAVGSNSNIAENGFEAEINRANILTVDMASGTTAVFASGLRNPVGMAWVDDTLWTVVNERDELGDNLVPDYMTSVQQGGFYGWPYSYFGQHIDSRVEQREPELVETAIKPDYALGAHTASLGLHYAKASDALGPLGSGMYIGQHGSWNREPKIGYKVVFVPFTDGQPDGMPVDVLTGFLNEEEQARGRPVGVILDQSGSLLVADDVGNVIWRVSQPMQGL